MDGSVKNLFSEVVMCLKSLGERLTRTVKWQSVILMLQLQL